MSTDFKFTSGDQATPENVAQVPLLLGTSSLGVIGDGYTFNPGDDVEGSIGSGPCVGLALAMGQVGPCVVGPVAPTYTALPSVTHLDASGGQSPTGPAITLTLAEAGVGPLDWSNLLLSVTADGMHVAIAYDGTTAAETMPIPPPTPAVLVGTAPITPTVLGSANGQTLVFSAPASQTLTLAAGSLAAAPAGIQAAVATITGGHTYTSSSWLAAGVAALAANPRKLTWTTAGMTPADVPTSITVTGTDYTTAVQTETITPDTSAGSVTTTKVYASLTSWSYTSAGGTAATLAVGYADAYATPQELANAVTTLATAAPLAVAGTVAQNSTEQLLQLASTAIGPGVTMTLSAQTLFGFASTPAPGNLTATGANGLRPFDWLGVVASFPAGPYTPLESY